MKLRIATFNCENLFARFRFRDNIDSSETSKNGFTINDLAFGFYDQDKRKVTADTIGALKADVIALQEIENLKVLERFRNEFLGGFKEYPHMMLVEGNDPRFINVAALSKYPIVHARSYRQTKATPRSRSFIFSRDCLEADLDLDGENLTLFINHFKSMIGGRAQTRPKRLEQVGTVKNIIRERFGSLPGSHPFIILGDFNDYIEAGHKRDSGVTELVAWDQVENIVERLDPDERWTHFYNSGKEYRQLDYILISKALQRAVKTIAIERRGMPLRAVRYTGPRFTGVGQDNPKASDHCPVLAELDI